MLVVAVFEAVANNIMVTKLWKLVEAGKTNEVISFYKEAFGAEEVGTVQGFPEINIHGLSIVIEDSADGPPEENHLIPVLQMEDVGAAIAKAVSAGAVELELEEWEAEFNGGPMGKVRDPYGFVWHICDHSSPI